jgi:uncharacterized protein (TIGR02687 family)
MDLDTIIQDLTRRFAAPLPEFYSRRIIFWHDEDREFEDKLDEIELNNAKLLVLTGKNNFDAKKLLAMDDIVSNYLVYDPISYDRQDDNWLLNIELYAEEFRADLNSIWMDEMGLPATQALRKQVKIYRKFMGAKDRRAKVAALAGNINSAGQLSLAVMAILCGTKDLRPNSIIRAVIAAGLNKDENTVYQSFVTYGAQNPFWVMVAQATGYSEGDDVSLSRLASHLLLTAATRTIKADYLAGLESYISIPHQSYCYDFISEWLHSEDNSDLYRVSRQVEDETRLYQRFSKLSSEDLIDTECFPCINKCILSQLMTEISDHIIKVDVITAAVEKRRTMAWYDKTACYFDCILQVARMQGFFLDHAAGFHTVEAKKVWEEYGKDYYRMDTWYRLFHTSFLECLSVADTRLDDLIKQVADKVEGLYNTWFLGNLGMNWTNAAAENLEKFGFVLEVPKQEDFYRSKVNPDDNRIFVIISDALRYEVGAALTTELRRETQCKAELTSVCSIFPSITKFGMAALLPHDQLSITVKDNGNVAVLADGQPTDAGYRDKLLKGANPNSVALKFKDIIGMKRAERSALVKGMEVVYIYHDKIDEAAHTSDTSVFPACEDAISDIKNLVRIIVNDFGGTHIFITADHGFLYTYSPLQEDSKVDKTSFKGLDAEYGRRYAILQHGTTPDYLMPVKFLDCTTEFDGFAPRENIRIKMNGGGLNYVHGGTSLQELVVPVIDYHFLRNDYKTYQKNKAKYDTKPVTVSLLSANRKIVNMIFSLNFYQREAVGDNREAATYLMYFVDASGKQISDTSKIIADKVSDNAQERAFRCSFTLKPLKYSNQDSYYLTIADESGLQMPIKEEFQIDIAFAVDDFDFGF